MSTSDVEGHTFTKGICSRCGVAQTSVWFDRDCCRDGSTNRSRCVGVGAPALRVMEMSPTEGIPLRTGSRP